MAIIPGYDGPFSHFSEIHAYTTGLYYGRNPEYNELPDYLWDVNHPKYQEDVETEPHYAYAGFDHGQLYHRHRKKIWTAVSVGLAAITIFMREAI